MPEDVSLAAKKISEAARLLLIIPPVPSHDQLGAATGLKTFLAKLQKESWILSPLGRVNQKMDFLAGFDEVLNDIKVVKNFVIDVSTKQVRLDELNYRKEEDRLSFYLKPKEGSFSADDVSFRTSAFPYDLILTIGVANLELLGEFFSKNAEMFYETPIVNIDHKASNEGYGQINLVELTASSCSEIVFDLVSKMEKTLIDKAIATALLTGLITETNSFQHSRTTPNVFAKASELITLGADQQKIVNNIYKSKSIGFLKLWGRVLARIKTDASVSLVYSAVNHLDVEKSQANEDDISQVIKEMASQLVFAKNHLFFRELQGTTEVFASVTPSVNLSKMLPGTEIKTISNSVYRFVLASSLEQAERTVLEIMKLQTGNY